MAETNADLDVALNDAQKAKGLQPNLPEISDTYGWILLKKGLADQAVTVFQDLVNRVPREFHLSLPPCQGLPGKRRRRPKLRRN
jgi:hypothetical protein